MEVVFIIVHLLILSKCCPIGKALTFSTYSALSPLTLQKLFCIFLKEIDKYIYYFILFLMNPPSENNFDSFVGDAASLEV